MTNSSVATSSSGSDYDVIIAGGGMVGASLALQLSYHSGGSLKVLVVESFPLPAENNEQPVYRPSFDARSSALSYGSRLILEQLDIWPQLSPHITPIDSIHVSERGGFASATLAAREMDWPALGYDGDPIKQGSQTRKRSAVEQVNADHE